MKKNAEYIKQIILKNIENQNFSVTLLAEELDISISHLRETVNNYYAMSPLKLIDSIKLEQAIYLLSDGASIDSVRRQTGYANTRTFRRVFKKRLHSTPSLCQKKLINSTERSLMIKPLIAEIWK